MFSWIPMHEEVARQLIERQAKGEDLVAVLREMSERGLTVISLDGLTVSVRDVVDSEALAPEIQGFVVKAWDNPGARFCETCSGT